MLLGDDEDLIETHDDPRFFNLMAGPDRKRETFAFAFFSNPQIIKSEAKYMLGIESCSILFFKAPILTKKPLFCQAEMAVIPHAKQRRLADACKTAKYCLFCFSWPSALKTRVNTPN